MGRGPHIFNVKINKIEGRAEGKEGLAAVKGFDSECG